MTVATQNERVPDEETPLLETQHKKAMTPIPWRQVSLVMIIQAGEPLTSQVIYPFTPEVRTELARDPRAVACLTLNVLCSSCAASA